MPVATPVYNLFYMAGRLCNLMRRPGIGLSPDDQSDCLQQANLMIGSANCNELFIYTRKIWTFDLTGAKVYTFGPSGDWDTMPADRPQEIDAATLVIYNTSGSPPVRLPITIWNFEQWSRLRQQDIPHGLPTRLYCDQNYPLANVYIWTQDQGAGDQIELYAWQSIPRFTAVTDTVSWPDGYEDWFVNNMAVRMANIFRDQGASVTDDVRMLASKSEAAIQSLNAPTPQMDVHPGVMPSRGYVGSWNRYSGE